MRAALRFAHRRAFVTAGLAQTALLLLQDFGRDPTGHPLQSSPIVALGIQLPEYAMPLLAGTAVWAALHVIADARRAPAWVHRVIGAVGLLWTAATLVIVVLDLGMQRFRAEPLSWNHFASYSAAGALLNSNTAAPILEQRGALAVTVAILVVALVALARAAWSEPGVPRAREPLLWAFAIAVAWMPTRLAWYHQRDLLQSPIARLWRTRHPQARRSPEDERRTRDALRRALDPSGRDVWLSDEYPLLRRAGRASGSAMWGRAIADPPDVVVLAIESLRGRDAGWGYGGRRGADSPTPSLDSLAADGVRYPFWIAGGDPSPRGYITLHTGVWEHPRLFITANFPALRVDAFPEFLRRRGYRAVALWSATPSFDNQLGTARRWYDETLFDREGAQRLYFRSTPDSVTVDRAMHWVDAHDAARPARPFVLYLATDGTHTPFPLPEGASDPGTRQGRYDLALRDTDHQLGRLVAALRRRPRWRNTVVLVVGDHGDLTDDAVESDLRGYPIDPVAVTSAFLVGPASLIGMPRVDTSAVGHADWFATVRSWFADTSAAVWMGHDLFDTTLDRSAVAVDSRGYRRQRNDGGLIVDANDPARWWSWHGHETPRLGAGPSPSAVSLSEWLRYWGELVEADRVLPPAPPRP